MKIFCSFVLIGALYAIPALAGDAGDMVFTERGPWDMSKGPVSWEISQTGPELESFKPLGKGTLTMDQVTDPSDGKPVLQLAESTDRIKRKIGPFPISGGDPSLTFFLETVARDMAAMTGGSPFYIRNRLKDALFRGGEVSREGDLTIASFEPFKDDKNTQRMYGFETLVLRFALSDPKQPIERMTAQTGPLAGDRPAYVNEMVLK
ncbi:hypothetical protein [Paracoccus aestuariivivens]|uniref:Uncharacterized protein n=1 Tax=Paracoccus aestuariivivens TaxID=1820333 RepID=A0A6L6J7S9_9RHOB|nr:hypothetical protein [Paracoccus aestuariivivens]MTH77616.1 hypothetical protein [Paracoccus aestuariivivens]